MSKQTKFSEELTEWLTHRSREDLKIVLKSVKHTQINNEAYKLLRDQQRRLDEAEIDQIDTKMRYEYTEHFLRAWKVISIVKHPPRAQKIVRPPASHLVSILDFLYSQKTLDDVFNQAISDGRLEYNEALSQGRTIKANYRHVVLYLIILKVSLLWAFTSVGKQIMAIWKAI